MVEIKTEEKHNNKILQRKLKTNNISINDWRGLIAIITLIGFLIMLFVSIILEKESNTELNALGQILGIIITFYFVDKVNRRSGSNG